MVKSDRFTLSAVLPPDGLRSRNRRMQRLRLWLFTAYN